MFFFIFHMPGLMSDAVYSALMCIMILTCHSTVVTVPYSQIREFLH